MSKGYVERPFLLSDKGKIGTISLHFRIQAIIWIHSKESIFFFLFKLWSVAAHVCDFNQFLPQLSCHLSYSILTDLFSNQMGGSCL